MTQIQIVIPPRLRPIAEGFNVRRAIPYAKKRMVGPFIFWDHMGPVTLQPEQPMNVGSHPHIGLSTLTYLFSGEALHRDSLGNELMIRPGEVNWMTAGKGIAHSERTQANEPMTMEGIQLWVALPAHLEQMSPDFQHESAEAIPTIMLGDQAFILIAGQFQNTKSPIKVHSPLLYLDGEITTNTTVRFTPPSNFEMALYVAKGEATINTETYSEGHMVVFEVGADIEFNASLGSRIMLLGGEVFSEGRHIWWNFVASDPALIEAAKIAWQNDEFDHVINESERLPLPKN